MRTCTMIAATLIIMVAMVLAYFGCQQPEKAVDRHAATTATAEWTPTTPPGDCGPDVVMPNLFLWKQPDFDLSSPYCWLPGHPWLEGDVNFDGTVNTFDLIAIRNHCLNRQAAPNPAAGQYFDCSLADLNHDGQVNVFDLIVARNNLNKSVPMGYVDGRWQE